MKKVVIAVAIGVPLLLLAWILWLPNDWQTWLGFTKQDYFVSGQNYAFYSGIGPMLLTAAGFSTIIGGLWHAHNCHYDGCWAIGRHRIKGSPYCNLHVEDAKMQKDTETLLEEILAVLKAQG
jgi:hypothetical protein